MAPMVWNRFIDKHKEGSCVCLRIEQKGKPGTDKSGKKLPTIYGLFKELVSRTVTSDWSSRSLSKAAIFIFEKEEDIENLKKFVGVREQLSPTKTPCASGYEFQFVAKRDYKKLAEFLGYEF